MKDILKRGSAAASLAFLTACASTPESFTRVNVPESGAVAKLQAESARAQADALLGAATSPGNIDPTTRGRWGAMAGHVMRHNGMNMKLSDCSEVPNLKTYTLICRSAQAVPAAPAASGPAK